MPRRARCCVSAIPQPSLRAAGLRSPLLQGRRCWGWGGNLVTSSGTEVVGGSSCPHGDPVLSLPPPALGQATPEAAAGALCALLRPCNSAAFMFVSHKYSSLPGQSGWKWHLEAIHTSFVISRQPPPAPSLKYFPPPPAPGRVFVPSPHTQLPGEKPRRSRATAGLGTQRSTQNPELLSDPNAN